MIITTMVRQSKKRLLVKNVKGTEDRRCVGHDSWLAHWESYTKDTSPKCSKRGCNEKATDGAHVIRVESSKPETERVEFIVPLCRSHNQKRDKFWLRKQTPRVVARVK
jgi:hypothetical protein